MAGFFVNLKSETGDFFARTDYRPDAWLLSSHRSTAGLAGMARRFAAEGCRVMADNGTIEFIRLALARHESEAAQIAAEWKALCREMGAGLRLPYASRVPAPIRARARALFEQLCADADAALAGLDPEALASLQLAMDPSHVIAREDWAVATALSLGLERELLGFGSQRYVQRNRVSLAHWRAARADPRMAGRKVFVTLAASDYTTARAAGREAARWGVRCVALGFASLNSDNSYTDSTYLPRRRRLAQPAPRRYIRLAEIVCGLRDGFRREGQELGAFHALGLGARAMWPILVAGLDEGTEITVDATSPIKDALGPAPVVYVPDDASGRMPVTHLAGHWLKTGELPFASPMLAFGLKTLPNRREQANAALAQLGLAMPTQELLHTSQPLGKALPLFANGPGAGEGNDCLIHHNYWVSVEAAAAIPQDDRRAWALAQLAAKARQTDGSITVRNGCRGTLDALGATDPL